MSIDGTWKVTMTTPMGAQDVTMTLASDGGTLTGSVAGPQGNTEITEGTVDGDSAAWKLEVSGPMGEMTLETKATVDGDAIKGEVQLGSFGTATFEGTREA
ncbi:MAG: hypothetical protein V3T15_02600 [Pseudomonadales bacterium]